MHNKIELNILTFILIEALFLLYSLKINIINLILGTILGINFIQFFSNIKKDGFIKIILLIISICLVIYSSLEITYFITNNLLTNYPYIIILISLFIVSYFLIKNNYHSFIKAVEIISYFFFAIKILSFLLVLPNINIDNINSSLLTELNINITILFVALIIFFLHQTIFYLTNNKVSKKTYIVSIINPFVIKILSILVMGKNLFYLYDYPYINVLRRIKYLNFIERMEGILSFEYLFSFIILLSFLLLFIRNALKKTN